MKNYLNFNLTGLKFLPIWIAFYLLFLVPYVLVIYKMQSFRAATEPQAPPLIFFLVLLAMVIVVLIITLYMTKMVIQNVEFNGETIKCDFKLGQYIGLVLLGIFLSIITIGIYSPWFIRNMQRFFINNSSYKSNKFSFLGNGGELFVIILLSVIIPMIILSVIIMMIWGIEVMNHKSAAFQIVYQIVVTIILAPYIYLIYKWMVNVKYADYIITWKTEFLPSIGKILLEMILTIITCGIYYPLAILRLYKYFMDKTKSNVMDNQQITFGYDIHALNDFLFLWGQSLLTVITFGIYAPWSMTKITKRILTNTYVEKIAVTSA